jgi:Tol biopolymer transport system component
MNEDGSDVKQITNIGRVYDAHYSPDGTKIIFSRPAGRNGYNDIWTMNADGSNMVNLTNTQDNIEAFPSYSPDGTRIAYTFASPAGVEIYVSNTDGSNRKPLTTGGYDLLPLWSPDGARVAFMSLRGAQVRGGYQIWVVNAAGTNLKQVTSNATANEYPVWSPDSSQLAYSQFAGNGWRVVAKNADGSGAERVVIASIGNTPGNSTVVGAWKGNRILIGGYKGNWDVYMVNADGTNLAQLTTDEKDDTPSDWFVP